MDRSLEALAQEVRKRANLNDDELLLAPEIAERVLGPRNLALGAEETPARLDSLRIIVPRDHPDMNFAVAHELGEWALRDIAKFQGDDLTRERAANYIGAAILAPARLVQRAHRFYGERVGFLARAFALSQTSLVLRLAEVSGDERAIVTRTGNVILRTNGAYPWANVPVVEVARGRKWRGLAKAKLRGGIDDGRVALRAK